MDSIAIFHQWSYYNCGTDIAIRKSKQHILSASLSTIDAVVVLLMSLDIRKDLALILNCFSPGRPRSDGGYRSEIF